MTSLFFETILLEVTIQKPLEALAVSCLVSCDFMHDVMDCIQIQLPISIKVDHLRPETGPLFIQFVSGKKDGITIIENFRFEKSFFS